jgi:large subunit ribosomal protein L29
MPLMRMQEIREMTSDERKENLNEMRTELSKIKTMIRAGGSVENPGRVKLIKKTIARILTVEMEEK